VSRTLAVAALLLLASLRLYAQSTDTSGVNTPSDSSVIARARRLAADDHAIAGRALLDSVVRATKPADSLHAEALFWRGTLAATAAEAERSYNRLLIESPLAQRAEDALLQLAQLKETRGDRRGAAEHLSRFMLSYSASAERPRAAVWLVRLLFDDSQLARGCDALRVAREAVPAEDIEQRNRLEYYAPRCARFAADSAAQVADTTTAPPYYSVQVAAYDSRSPAERMARTLVERGMDARVDGMVRPFRVRIGKYPSHAEAARAAAKLKSQGIRGFIAHVTAPPP